MKEYRTGTARQIRVTSVLGKGGEGTVFDVDGVQDVAAKIYTDGKHLERRDKISAMVANGLHKQSALVAFPIDTLFGDRGEFAGFIMRKVAGFKPIHELYAPGSRRAEFPNADFRFLARTATNVARAVGSVHQAGCVIGDINHSGLLVGDQATVTLIDADSFQVKLGSSVYRCRVGVGEYTPPELQGAALDRIDRQPAHDAFGLAVIVFQLLFMGRHPFAGRFGGQGDMPIERAIKEGRFAYSVQRRAETRMDPPPFAPTLLDVTPDLAGAFELAFTSNPNQFRNRPTAADWVHVLQRFETELIPCRINPVHHHARNAAACPWCRLETGLGVSLFPSAGGPTGSTSRSNFDLTRAMAAIQNVVGPGAPPDPGSMISLSRQMTISPAAQEVRRSHALRQAGALAIAAACIALVIGGVPIALLGLIGAGFMMLGGASGSEKLRAAKVRAENEWSIALQEWQLEAGSGNFERKKGECELLAGEYRSLEALEKSRLADLESRRRDIQLQRWLEGHLIVRAKVAGIGDTKKATLASYGIENAFDVTREKVLKVPGFGTVTTAKLTDWRKSIERRFVFNPALATDPHAVQAVKASTARRRAEIERILVRGPVALEQLRTHALSVRGRPTQRLIEAYRALKQAQHDLC